MTWDKIVKAVAALAGAAIGVVTKSWTPMLTALAVVMGADYISGMIVAACRKSPNTEGGGLSSKVGFVGLAKKYGSLYCENNLYAVVDKPIATPA